MASAYQEVAAPPGKVRVVVWRLDANEADDPLVLSEYGSGPPPVQIQGEAVLEGEVNPKGEWWVALSGREGNEIEFGLHAVNERPYKVRPRAGAMATAVWLLIPA